MRLSLVDIEHFSHWGSAGRARSWRVDPVAAARDGRKFVDCQGAAVLASTRPLTHHSEHRFWPDRARAEGAVRVDGCSDEVSGF